MWGRKGRNSAARVKYIATVYIKRVPKLLKSVGRGGGSKIARECGPARHREHADAAASATSGCLLDELAVTTHAAEGFVASSSL